MQGIRPWSPTLETLLVVTAEGDIEWLGARDAARCAVTYRTKNQPAPSADGAKGEKPWGKTGWALAW